MGSSKKQTVGYRYFMGLHFAICQGPVDALLQINAGDRNAWDGTVRTSPIRVRWAMLETEINMPIPESGGGPATESKRIRIVAPELFGGDKKEGGVMGWADVMMGEAGQAPNDYLVSQLGNPMPAFRGILSLVFRKGLIGAMNPYPKPWSFKVRRILKGWGVGGVWYPEKAPVSVSGEPPESYGFSYVTGAGARQHLISRVNAESEPPVDYVAKIRPPELSAYNNTRRVIIKRPGGVVYDSGWIGNPVDADDLAAALETAGREDLSGEIYEAETVSSGRIPTAAGGITVELYCLTNSRPATSLTSIYVDYESWGSQILGMNPAHIVCQALTNSDWGMGYPMGALDLASFTAAADTFHAEGIGLCGQWTRQDTIESFVQEVLSHAGAALGQDPRTGLFRLIPTRGGYDVATLPEFRRGLNVSAVDSFERAALGETVNEVTVQYVDASTGNDGAVTVQHLANVQAQGGVVSQSVRYPMAPTASIAQRLAQRDLTAKASPLCKVKLTADRSAFGLLPGDVVRWTDAKLGIVDMPMRVLQVDYGSLTAGAIKLDLAEDVFGMPATTYLGQQDGGWVEPSGEPSASPAVEVLEVPMVSIYRDDGASSATGVPAESGVLGILAASPGGATYGYSLYSRIGAGEFEQSGAGEWAASGVLSEAIGPQDVTLELGGVSDASEFTAGALLLIGSGRKAELARVDSATNDGGAITLTVGRGVGDTVPHLDGWPLGTRVWVVDSNLGTGSTEFASGEAVTGRAGTNATGGTLSAAESPGETITMDGRVARPYPPGRVRVDGQSFPDEVEGAFPVTWAHRDRLLQQDQLVDSEAASIGPEPEVHYLLRFIDADTDATLVERQDIGSNGATVELDFTGPVRMELAALRDGLESWHAVVREFEYTADPGVTESTINAPTYTPGETIIDAGEVEP